MWVVAPRDEEGGEMTNDDRKHLEDRIYEYGTMVRDGSGRLQEKAWDRVMYAVDRISSKEEKG